MTDHSGSRMTSNATQSKDPEFDSTWSFFILPITFFRRRQDDTSSRLRIRGISPTPDRPYTSTKRPPHCLLRWIKPSSSVRRFPPLYSVAMVTGTAPERVASKNGSPPYSSCITAYSVIGGSAPLTVNPSIVRAYPAAPTQEASRRRECNAKRFSNDLRCARCAWPRSAHDQTAVQ